MENSIYFVVDKTIDYAFTQNKFILDLYELAQSTKMSQKEMSAFIQSSVAEEVVNLVTELDEYIKGGPDSEHQQLTEAYGNIPKPRARKIRNYLYQLIQDAYRYERDQRRRKKRS